MEDSLCVGSEGEVGEGLQVSDIFQSLTLGSC